MKLLEVVEQSLKFFARTSDGTRYDIVLKGGTDLSLSYNAFDDIIYVWSGDERIDMIDISKTSSYFKAYGDYDASISIGKTQKGLRTGKK